MSSLENKKISESYKDLLQVSNSNSGVDATLQTVEDGEGTSSSLKLSDRQAEVLPAADGTAVFDVSKSDGTSILSVDTTNSKVIATELDISGNVDIDGTTNLDAVDIDGEVNVGGNYILNEQGKQNHVANTMSSPYYRFDGTNDYISLGTDAKLDITEAITLSSWVRGYSSAGDTSFFIICRDDDATHQQYFINFSYTQLSFRIFDGGSAQTVSYSVDLRDDKWHHVAGTYDGSNLKLYLDGVEVATQAYSGDIDSEGTNEPVFIGQRGDNARRFYGDIAQAQIFNLALSATEIKNLYSGESLPYKYKGADNTHRVTSNFAAATNNQLGASVSSLSLTGGTLNATANGYDRIGAPLSSTLEKGKLYRISWNHTNTVNGTIGIRCATGANLNDSTTVGVGYYGGSAGTTHTSSVDFIGDGTATHIGFKSLHTSGTNTIVISNFDIREIGCVAEYDGTGVSSYNWLDKSGNDLHGPVTGATVANAPSGDDGLVYEEGVHEVTITSQTSGSWEVSSSHKHLSYVRIGNLVHVSGYLNVTNDLSANGNIVISLPYTSATGLSGSADLQWGFGSISHGGSTVSGMTSMAYIPENSSFFHMAYVQDDGTYSYFTEGNLDTDFIIRVGFSYRI